MKQNNYLKDFKNKEKKIYVYMNNNFKFINNKKI
jgi:hypothetical protein